MLIRQRAQILLHLSVFKYTVCKQTIHLTTFHLLFETLYRMTCNNNHNFQFSKLVLHQNSPRDSIDKAWPYKHIESIHNTSLIIPILSCNTLTLLSQTH